MAMTQKAQELRDQGVDVISFSAGEPDFDTPAHIIDGAKQALDTGETRYTAAAGTTALKRAVAAQSEEVRGVFCSSDQVIICAGAKHVLYNFFMAVLNPGDEVIIPVPSWVSYPDQVLLAGGVPVLVQTTQAQNWVLSPDALENAVTANTRVLLLNSPSNPTGGLIPKAEMTAIVEKALSLGLLVISDEIYRDLVYDGNTFVSALESVSDRQDQIFTVDGVSKTYAMTGWRIGWGIGAPEIVSAMTKIQGQSISCPCAVSQAAALVAVTRPLDYFADWKAAYLKRRNQLVKALNDIPGVTCPSPQGAFYAFPEVSGLIQKLGVAKTDIDFASWLLQEAHIAVVPGTPFGAPGHIRFAYATSLDAISVGMERMAAACRRLPAE